MDIVVPRGTSYEFRVKLRTQSGAHYQLNEGDMLIFGIKHYIEHKHYIFTQTKSYADYDADYDGYVFRIAPEDTADLEFGDYVYDIGCQTASGDYYSVIKPSKFIVDHMVTRKVTENE